MVKQFLPSIAVVGTILAGSAYGAYTINARRDQIRGMTAADPSMRLPLPVRRTPLFVAGGGSSAAAMEELASLSLGSDRTLWRRFLFSLYIIYRSSLLIVRCVPVVWYLILSRFQLCDDHLVYVALREMLIDMGPTYMKLGQWMATRPDVFPEDLCQTLTVLFDSTPAHSWRHTEQRLRNAGILPHLSSIEREPLNSGSVAQVHRGVLRHDLDGIPAGTEIVTKVLHPGIEIRIAADVSAMRYAARVFKVIIPGFEYTDPIVQVDEFASLIFSQLDLVRECDNLQQFRYNFQDMPRIVFPTPLPSITARDVLVETFEEGQCIQKGNALAVHDMELAELGCNMFHKMLFHDNFVHSDLHPGNVLVRDYIPPLPAAQAQGTADTANKGKSAALGGKQKRLRQIVVLDTGLVTSLSPKERRNFLALFGAVAAGDGEFGAKLMISNSKHHQCTNEAKFVAEMKEVFDMVNPDKTAGFNLADVKIGDVLTRVMSTLRRNRVNIDGNFSSLVLTVIVGEGMGRKLHPQFNIFQASAPYLVQYLDGSELKELAGKLRTKYGIHELVKAFGGNALGSAALGGILTSPAVAATSG